MFGISFGEFAVIFIVALIVIGPQKLPETIRAVGGIIQKIRAFTEQVKKDVAKEFPVDEITKSFQETKNSLTKQLTDTTNLDEVKKSLQEARKVTESSIRDSQKAIDHTIHSDLNFANHSMDDEEAGDIADYYDDYYSASEITEPPKNYQALLNNHIESPSSNVDELIILCQARQFELFMQHEDSNYLTYQLKYSKVRELDSLPKIVNHYHDTLVELNHQ